MSLPLSVAIVTLNEEQNLPRCLASVRDLAAEIVIIDSGSTDRTVAIGREAGAVVEYRPWPGFGPQKNAALERCTHAWVLCLDADEEVSPELAASLRLTLANDDGALPDGFWINRRTWYLGAWIRHAWNPEWKLLLARRDRARWAGWEPHAVLTVPGRTARLTGDVLHYSFRDLNDHLQKTLRYAQVMAQAYAQRGIPFRWHQLIFSPWWAFVRRLVLKQAWRDGWRGWLIAFQSLIGSFAKHAFALEIRLRQSTGKPT